MKSLFVLALAATVAGAESHPSWWPYTSPKATALVGIQWNHLRNSPLAAAIEAEISPAGSLGFPDLDCLRQASEIVISSPALLAAAAGSFPAATVEDQAQRKGLRRLVYRGVTLWLPSQAEKLGMAQVNEELILVGARKTLEAAVDGSLSKTARQESPLLAGAELFSETGDLWVVATKLPDPLAGRFVPLDAIASEFLGQVSVRDGLTVQASFDAGSEAAARQFARRLREQAPTFPAVARGLQAAADRNRVTIALQASPEDLMAALPSAGPVQPPDPVRFEITHVEEFQPRIIRIFNLEEGTREIVLSPSAQRLSLDTKLAPK